MSKTLTEMVLDCESAKDKAYASDKDEDFAAWYAAVEQYNAALKARS